LERTGLPLPSFDKEQEALMTQWKAWFMADWERAVFIHFKLDPRRLAPFVGFDLDTWEGAAIVSLVAFTQSRLRPTIGGRFSEWLSTPLACHEFLNLRTYVGHGDDRGIYFLSEWIPNRLAALLGPAMYGLPYRVGRLQYRFEPLSGEVSGRVRAKAGMFEFRGSFNPSGPLRTAANASLEHFLVERYVAFTLADGVERRFRIHHPPWELADFHVEIPERSLLGNCAPWLGEPFCAHFSPGVRDVAIGPPERIGLDAKLC
jgi:uncharacterized protein YqjF (DUF2071 family)